MDYIFYIPGVILLVVAVPKFWALKGAWLDPLITAGSSILLVGALVCILSAPPTIRAVNSLTGIANFSAALVYSGMSALSAGYLVLMITWRGGPADRVRQASRLVVCVYALVTIGIVVLFALADVPVERTRDLDTYYATTPYMREMILLYLVFHTLASVTLAHMCLSWRREVSGLTRTGLTLIVIGAMFDLSYQMAKYAAMAARWQGRDWDFLSTSVSPPLVAVAGVTVAAGFALPRVGPSMAGNVRAWKRYRLLEPLWSELRELRAPTQADTHWWDRPVVRLAQREMTIHDGVLLCHPLLDNEVRTVAYQAALAQSAKAPAPPGSRPTIAAAGKRLRRTRGRPRGPGADEQRPDHESGQSAKDHAAIVGDAAMLAAACVRVSTDESAEVPSDAGRLQSLAEPYLMVGLSQALATSTIVAEARHQAALQKVNHDQAR
ncbi:hypothetical protein [Streptomyces sp. NPDC050704]|uniref:hypothetical protein n=1 Tax=Streptomyces sp. NPDC050704 TaxID=3157219 RepID=UPI00342511F6